MRHSVFFFGEFFTAAIFLFLIPISFFALILPSTLTIPGLMIAWLRKERRKILILLTVIVSCTLLGCLIYSWAISRPVEEPRIESQSIDPDLSDSKTSSGGSNTGTGRTFPAPESSGGYIGNTESKKFHESSCSYLPDPSNRTYFDTRDEALNSGYSPCGHCHP